MAKKKDYYEAIVEVLESASRKELADVMRHEIELLEKKEASAKKGANSKKAEKNAPINEAVYNILLEKKVMTSAEIMDACDLPSTQMAVARGNDLVAQGKAIKDYNEKKKVIYRLVE